MSLRDTLIMDAKTLANETLTNTAIYFAMDLLGVPAMIYSSSDNSITTAVKSGFVASAANLGGAILRSNIPQLNVL